MQGKLLVLSVLVFSQLTVLGQTKEACDIKLSFVIGKPDKGKMNGSIQIVLESAKNDNLRYFWTNAEGGAKSIEQKVENVGVGHYDILVVDVQKQCKVEHTLVVANRDKID